MYLDYSEEVFGTSSPVLYIERLIILCPFLGVHYSQEVPLNSILYRELCTACNIALQLACAYH